jgi:hypothetical protein
MTRIATATDWEVTESPINEAGEVVGDSVAWQKAIEAAGPWGGRLKNDLQQALSRSLTVGNKMARASLVKADFLMRSLGRPNRDQVVTVRPTELTQLEAMDLSNGQTLADWLKQGGQRWHAAIENQRVERGAKSVDGGIWEARNIIEQLYWQALCREPNTAEWAAIEELVGPELDAVEIEDILWAIVMLPEFQYVR